MFTEVMTKVRRLAALLVLVPCAAAEAQSCPGATDPVCPYVSRDEFGDHPADLRFPQAVAFDRQGRVLVGDQLGNAVRRFDAAGRAERLGWMGRPRDQRVGGVGGLTVGPDGLIYAADAGNSEIDVLREDGTQVRTIGARQLVLGAGGRAAANTAGGDVAVSGGEVFVANTGGDAISVFDAATGARKRVLRWRTGRRRLDAPQGLDVRGDRLIVADTVNRRVLELTRRGRYVRETRVRLRSPYDVAILPDGGVLVADNESHRILRLDRRLRSRGVFGRTALTFPRSLTVGGGRVAVTDSARGRVHVLSMRGRRLRTLGRTARRPDALSHPTGIAVAPDGAAVIADTGAERMARWTPGGRPLNVWGGRPQLDGAQDPATYDDVYGVAIAADGRMAVTDRGRVQLLDARGRFVRQLTDPFPRWDPGIPLFEPDGRLWVPDREYRSRVDELAPDLRPLRSVGGAAFGKALTDFSRPAAVARRADGMLVVADPNNSRVALVDPALGRVVGELRSPLMARPTAVAAGAAGTYVSDANERILLFRPDGSVSAFGEPGRGPGQLSGVRGIALTCAGELLVSDQFNNRVQRFRLREEPARACPPAPEPFAAPPGPPVVSVRLLARGDLSRATRLRFRVRCSRACSLSDVRVSFGRTRELWGELPRLDGARTLRRVGPGTTYRWTARDAARLRSLRRRGETVILRVSLVATSGPLRSTRVSDRRL
jgi:DNA-binding beta-propeller fold protein YncE